MTTEREQIIRTAWADFALRNPNLVVDAAQRGDTLRMHLEIEFDAVFPPDMAAEIDSMAVATSVDVHPEYNDPGDDWPGRTRQVRWVCEDIVLTGWQPL